VEDVVAVVIVDVVAAVVVARDAVMSTVHRRPRWTLPTRLRSLLCRRLAMYSHLVRL
jgi:hypothetical protein